MSDSPGNYVTRLVEGFEGTLRKSFAKSLEEARPSSEEFLKKERWNAFSLLLVSSSFDLSFFDYTFMRKPVPPFSSASYLASLTKGISKEDIALAARMERRLEEIRKERDLILLTPNLLGKLLLEIAKEEGMAEEGSGLLPSLPPLLSSLKGAFDPLKEESKERAKLWNACLILDGNGEKGEKRVSRLYQDLYAEFTSACPSLSEGEKEEAISSCLENVCELLSKCQAGLDEGFLVALESMKGNLKEQAEKNVEEYKKPPFEAETSYGEWLYCLALFFAMKDVDLLSASEIEQKQQAALEKAFKDNPKMLLFGKNPEEEGDSDTLMMDSAYIYGKFLYERKEEFGLSEETLPLVAFFICASAWLKAKDAWTAPITEEFLILASHGFIFSSGRAFEFDSPHDEARLPSPERLYFKAGIAANVACNYFSTGLYWVGGLKKRSPEFKKRLLALKEGKIALNREKKEIERFLDPSLRDVHFSNVLYFRRLAEEFLEKERGKKEPHQC